MSFDKVQLHIYKSGQDGDGTFLDKVSILENYEALTYTKGHYAPGNFQLTLNQETARASDLLVGRIIRIGEDDTKAVIINTIRRNLSQDGSTIMTASGQELWSLLGRRVINPSGTAYYETTTTTPVETGVKGLIAAYAGPSAGVVGARMSKLNIVADGAGGPAYKFSERFGNLLEVVSKALLATNSGLTCTLNHTTKKWDLDWTAGTDRTGSVIISSKFNTARSATVTETDVQLRNLVIAAGQGEGVNRTVRVVYDTTEPTDIDRREIFRDMRDLEQTTSIDKRAEQVLAEQSYTKTLEVSPLTFARVVYDRDYFVGDKIKFDELGVTEEAWITSATEEWKSGSYDIKLGIDKAPATIAGQIGALSASNTQANATIENLVYTTDGTLSGNSDLEYPTEKAVKTYVDKQSINYPTDENVFCKHSFDAIPSITYPDNPAGTTYKSNFATTDGWLQYAGTVALSVSGGVLSLNGTGYYEIYKPTLGTLTNKYIVVRIRSKTASFNILSVRTGASTYTPLGPAFSTEWVTLSGYFSSFYSGGPVLRVDNGVDPDVDIDYIYIGDGSYTWQIGDDSGNGNVLVPIGGLSRVTGRSGYAMKFDGTTGYAIGNLSGFTDKITVSFWEDFAAFSTTAKILFESSSNVETNNGAFFIVHNSGGNAGRLRAYIRSGAGATGTGLLSGYYLLPSSGLHHIAMVYDKNITSNSALLLFVDGVQVSLTYDFPYSGAGALPTVYNGPFYVHSRTGSSLFADGTMDELRIDRASLTTEDVQSLYRIPMQGKVNYSGNGADVKQNEPTIFGAIPIMSANTQSVSKTIPTGYNAIVYGDYDIGNTELTLDGDFVVL